MSVLAPPPPDVRASSPAHEVVGDEARDRGAARVLRTAVSAFLAGSAAAWMIGGSFKGLAPRAVGILGAALGAGGVALSYRSRRPALVQALVLPFAMLVGALLVLPDARGGADVPALVSEALRAGGLAQPPLPFEPGWRFVVVVLLAILTAGATATAVAMDRAKLAVAIPVPLVLAAAMIQPPSGEVVASAVAIVLVLAGLAVAYGAELASEGTTAGSGFELRRLVRGGAVLLALSLAIAGLGEARFLFPDTTRERVIPPTRPSQAPPQADRVLFRVTSASPGPWRVGVLDVYDGRGWLFPPYDTSRLRPLEGAVRDPRFTVTSDAGTERTRFEILGFQGYVLPTAPNAMRVEGLPSAQYDPRTQGLRLADRRANSGLTYTVVAPKPPGGAALRDAPPPPAWTEEFRQAPLPPNEVVALLRDAPENPWDRLQFVRARFYEKVVAAGAGQPVDVPPQRVVDLLAGGEGTPWEITAAEALLARWAGVPSRIGFGFYRGERKEATPFAEVRPRHGATWLEVYVEGHGWVPIVGVPPRARPSLSEAEQNPNENVLATDEVALVVHVPIRLTSIQLLYVTVRYWVARALPLLALLLLAWWAMPGVLKRARRVRRARWARARGPVARIAVAYAEMRDALADLGIRAPTLPPVRFLGRIEPDDEHDELAWLVTRAVWGDLGRDLRDEDAMAAEEMSRSVARRVARAQPVPTRVLAFGARTSLREPWSAELPNLWPAWIERRPVRSFVRTRIAARRRRGRAKRLARRLARTTLLALALVPLSGCAQGYDPDARYHAGRLPERVMPSRVEGMRVQREPTAEAAYARAGDAALVRDGRVYTLRAADVVEGYVQVAALLPSVDARDPVVRRSLLRSIGAGRFRLRRLGEERVWAQDLPQQRMLLWFTPDDQAVYLQVTRRSFERYEETFLDVIRYVEGTAEDARERPVPEHDPRRGREA